MSTNPVYGTYRASVVNNNDPLFEARVTLSIPQVLGTAESNWAVPSSPTDTIPNVGDVVWVSFDGGDITAPVYQAVGLKQLDQKISEVSSGTTNVPKQPTGLALTTQPVVADDGTVTAEVVATWIAPTENQDGSSLTDLAGYYVQYSYDDTTWSGGASTTDTTMSFTGLNIGVNLWIRVAAYTKSSTPSLWSSVKTVTASSTSKPQTLSTPSVVGVLGGIRVSWDGHDSTEAAVDPYFAFARVERDTSAAFPNPVAVAAMNGADNYNDTGVGYTQTYFYRLVAVSRTGVSGDPSGYASATAKQAVDTDILDAAITSAKIATAAIDSTKIANDAVQAQNIADGAVAAGKLAAAAVTSTNIADQAIATNNIALGAITTDLINTGAITADRIAAGAVGTAQIADFALTVLKFRDDQHHLY